MGRMSREITVATKSQPAIMTDCPFCDTATMIPGICTGCGVGLSRDAGTAQQSKYRRVESEHQIQFGCYHVSKQEEEDEEGA